MASQVEADQSSLAGTMVGAVYVERGEYVTVIARWQSARRAQPASALVWHRPPRSAPRNVLIRRANGSLVVRPFRGLRRP